MANEITYLNDEPIYYGATPKFHLDIDAGELDMDDFNFEVRLQRGPNSLTIPKSEMIEDNGDYYITVDTTALGVGWVKAAVIADIPDTDYQGGTRTEIVVKERFINILPL